jgi:hypothetical protein
MLKSLLNYILRILIIEFIFIRAISGKLLSRPVIVTLNIL